MPTNPDALSPRQELLDELILWVHSRIDAEVTHRPDVNIHKRTLSETWHQVLRKLEDLTIAQR